MGFWEPLLFWIFAGGALVSSAMVVLWRNPLYSALALIIDFFFFAGLYALLSAHLMAILQVLVYAGAIMVLFLFIIMLLNLREERAPRFAVRPVHAASLAGGAVVLFGSVALLASGGSGLAMFGAAGLLLFSFVFIVFGRYEFRIQQIVSGVAVAGLLFFLISAIAPIAPIERIEQARLAQDGAYQSALAAWSAETIDEDGVVGEALEPELVRATSSSFDPRLYIDLNEAGLERAWRAEVDGWVAGTDAPSAGKWPRFEADRAEVIPPAFTGVAMVTERAVITATPRPSFGTMSPLSVLIVNRFVIPFELTALLLLAAIVGAVIIAKRRIS